MIKDVSINVQAILIDYGVTVTAVVDETDRQVSLIEAECFDATGTKVAGPFQLDVRTLVSGNDYEHRNGSVEPLPGITADDVVYATVTMSWMSTATGDDNANSPASTVPSSKKKYPKKGKKKSGKKKAKRKRAAAARSNGAAKKNQKAVARKKRKSTKASPRRKVKK